MNSYSTGFFIAIALLDVYPRTVQAAKRIVRLFKTAQNRLSNGFCYLRCFHFFLHTC